MAEFLKEPIYQQLRISADIYPEDHDRKLILADYLEEIGNITEAEFWRWLNLHKLTTYRHQVCPWYAWANAHSSLRQNSVPQEIYQFIYPQWFYNHTEAVDALMKAYFIWLRKYLVDLDLKYVIKRIYG